MAPGFHSRDRDQILLSGWFETNNSLFIRNNFVKLACMWCTRGLTSVYHTTNIISHIIRSWLAFFFQTDFSQSVLSLTHGEEGKALNTSMCSGKIIYGNIFSFFLQCLIHNLCHSHFIFQRNGWERRFSLLLFLNFTKKSKRKSIFISVFRHLSLSVSVSRSQPYQFYVLTSPYGFISL